MWTFRVELLSFFFSISLLRDIIKLSIAVRAETIFFCSLTDFGNGYVNFELNIYGTNEQVAPLELVFGDSLFLQTERPDGTKTAPLGAICLQKNVFLYK